MIDRTRQPWRIDSNTSLFSALCPQVIYLPVVKQILVRLFALLHSALWVLDVPTFNSTNVCNPTDRPQTKPVWIIKCNTMADNTRVAEGDVVCQCLGKMIRGLERVAGWNALRSDRCEEQAGELGNGIEQSTLEILVPMDHLEDVC